MRRQAKEESYQIVEQAKLEAKAQAERTAEEARVQADQLFAKAQADIASEREYAMRQMQGEIGKLAMEAAARIVGSQAGEEQDLSMYDQFIEKAGDPDDNGSCPGNGTSFSGEPGTYRVPGKSAGII